MTPPLSRLTAPLDCGQEPFVDIAKAINVFDVFVQQPLLVCATDLRQLGRAILDLLQLLERIDLNWAVYTLLDERDNRFRNPCVDERKIGMKVIERVGGAPEWKWLFPPFFVCAFEVGQLTDPEANSVLATPSGLGCANTTGSGEIRSGGG